MNANAFHTTRWTLVRHATGHSTAGRQALSELCEAYYEPVVAFLRHQGRSSESARELAHEFFACLLESPNFGHAEPGRGRFRSYLLGALKHYLSHKRAKDSRQKRGGGAELVYISLGTDTSPGTDPCDEHTLPPDREFDRRWAIHALRRATEALAEEWRKQGKEDEFIILQPFIGGHAPCTIASLAEERGESAATLRKTVSRMRQRFRHYVKAQLAPALVSPLDIEDEMRALLSALSG